MNETMNPDVEHKTLIKTELSKEHAKALKDKKVRSFIRRSSEIEVQIAKPKEFFKDIDRPVTSRLDRWLEEVKSTTEEHLDNRGYSRIVEVNPANGKSRWRMIQNWSEFQEAMKSSEKSYGKYMKMREQRVRHLYRQGKEFGDFGFGGSGGNDQSAFPVRGEYTPLIGSPFFKQLYLYDYWSMHSKCFWYQNYSPIAKMVKDITRNFVMGNGFSVVFTAINGNKSTAMKAEEAWKKYEEFSKIQETAPSWCDDLTWAGENMIRRQPTAKGVLHKSFDPSTCWEIVTEPTDISDIKYYHIQYNTQYQLYGDKKTPLSKYVLEQLPPQMVMHNKINVSNYEKRGRSDLLSPLIYFKYYEDYLQARLIRAKNEAAFIWDVTVKGGQEDIDAYISGTESMTNVPPGSENVHNEAITRTPMSPQLSTVAKDNVAVDILSMVAMSQVIPVSFFGGAQVSTSTKAGAVVGTEPVVKKMTERQNVMKQTLRQIVVDVLVQAKIDPATVTYEIVMPDILEGDSQAKVKAYYAAKDEKVISHKTMSQLVAKELKVQQYDYDDEQEQIETEAQNSLLFPDAQDPDLDPDSGVVQPEGLTGGNDDADNSRNRTDKRSDVNSDSRE